MPRNRRSSSVISYTRNNNIDLIKREHFRSTEVYQNHENGRLFSRGRFLPLKSSSRDVSERVRVFQESDWVKRKTDGCSKRDQTELLPAKRSSSNSTYSARQSKYSVVSTVLSRRLSSELIMGSEEAVIKQLDYGFEVGQLLRRDDDIGTPTQHELMEMRCLMSPASIQDFLKSDEYNEWRKTATQSAASVAQNSKTDSMKIQVLKLLRSSVFCVVDEKKT